jgi:hypothetical protein
MTVCYDGGCSIPGRCENSSLSSCDLGPNQSPRPVVFNLRYAYLRGVQEDILVGYDIKLKKTYIWGYESKKVEYHCPRQLLPGSLIQQIKRSGDVGQSPLSRAEVKNAWRQTSIPHMPPWSGAQRRTGTSYLSRSTSSKREAFSHFFLFAYSQM